MPRWKALPEELDPEIREFASQMRQLVDRGGLSLATVSDKTGYSKTSWERYLNGRLLPPQGAVSALAEVTGTDVRHLATMWELAERAWSRAEMRHDMTMEAIRISQAREALAKVSEDGKGKKKSRSAKPSKPSKKDVRSAAPAAPPKAPAPAPPASPPAAPGPVRPAPEKPAEDEPARASWPNLNAPAARADATVRIARTKPAAEDRTGGAPAGPPASPFDARGPYDAEPGRAERTDDAGRPADADPPASPAEADDASSDLVESAELAGRSANEPEDGPLSMSRTGPADLRKRPGRPEWPAGWPAPDDGEPSDRQPSDRRPEGGQPRDADLGGPQSRNDRPEWSARLSGVPAKPPEGFESTTILRRQSREDAPGEPVASAHEPFAAGGGSGAGQPTPPGPPTPADGERKPSQGRRMAMVLAGAVGALAVIGAAVFFLDVGGDGDSAKPEPSSSPSQNSPKLPEGVKCSGADCAGEDPELMGCGGQYAETTSDAMVGSAYVEVRYSDVCKASWARVGGATPGTTVTVDSAGEEEDDEVTDASGGYTKMVAAKSAKAAKACVETAGGMTGCTTP